MISSFSFSYCNRFYILLVCYQIKLNSTEKSNGLVFKMNYVELKISLLKLQKQI